MFSAGTISAFENLLFTPPVAATFEPRIGANYEMAPEKLRLDIGASVDLCKLYTNQDIQIRLGADFFTYTRLRSAGRFKFPVETSDYFFGINASMMHDMGDGHHLGARLRLSHISSHMVDGYTDPDWQFRRDPFVYSREFVDLLAAWEMRGHSAKYRIYAGASAIFSTIPDDVAKFVPQIGVDAEQWLMRFLSVRAGIDYRMMDTDALDPALNQLAAQLGIMLYTSKDTGILLNYNFYNGKSMHGMFFRERDFYHAVGFQLIFY